MKTGSVWNLQVDNLAAQIRLWTGNDAGILGISAANLIWEIKPAGAELASTFRQLVANKDSAQYAPKSMGESSAKAAGRQAADLVSEARIHP